MKRVIRVKFLPKKKSMGPATLADEAARILARVKPWGNK